MVVTKMMKNLLRAQEILGVFFRHGFGDLVQRLGLSGYLTSTGSGEQPPQDVTVELTTPARRFRNALEDLGGAFVKLGQLLSTRPDILPQQWLEELVALQDDVRAVEFDDIRKIIEEDLGPIDDNFRSVDPAPLATASVAQVHVGVTLAGRNVVLKVRKPGIKATVLQDCDILEALAELLEKHVPESGNYRPVQIVEEFRAAVNEELDFTREGQNLDRFAADFEPYPQIKFPTVHWDQTTERVLAMEHVDGLKISLVDQLRAQGVDTAKVARNLAEAVLRQILEFGFFHGDPHPGNLLVVGRETVCFIDCGMVGRLEEQMREHLILLVSAGIRKETRVITDILVEMNALPEDLDRAAFLREANQVLDRYYRLPLKRIRIAAIIEDLTRLIHRFRIRIPSELLLVGKALITLEGVGRTLDPDFDVVEVAEPFVREIVATIYGPKYVSRRILESSQDFLRLLRDLPSDLRELSRHMRENRLGIVLQHQGLSEAFRQLDRASRRISVGMVLSALVIGSSLITLGSLEPRILGIPAPALVGFGVATALAGWFFWTLFRDES